MQLRLFKVRQPTQGQIFRNIGNEILTQILCPYLPYCHYFRRKKNDNNEIDPSLCRSQNLLENQGEHLREKIKERKKSKEKKNTKYSKKLRGSIYLCKSALHLENVPVHIISYNYKIIFILRFFSLTMSCFIYLCLKILFELSPFDVQEIQYFLSL